MLRAALPQLNFSKMSNACSSFPLTVVMFKFVFADRFLALVVARVLFHLPLALQFCFCCNLLFPLIPSLVRFCINQSFLLCQRFHACLYISFCLFNVVFACSQGPKCFICLLVGSTLLPLSPCFSPPNRGLFRCLNQTVSTKTRFRPWEPP